MTWPIRCGSAALAACLLALTGCATPGPPQPPSLHLPGRVTDLNAVRTGNTVALSWTMPKRDTDRESLKHPLLVHICRSEREGECLSVADITAGPGQSTTFSEVMPAALTAGTPRPVRYFVELHNRSGKSSGLSDPAVILAGQAPSPVTGFAAAVRKSGVALRWKADSPAETIRLHRTLVPSAAAKASAQSAPAHRDILAPAPEPVQQTLLVADDPGRALDRAITFGQTYEYRAQRVARIASDGKTAELAGELSAPIRVEVVDIFPPAVPTGLAAVTTMPDPNEPGGPAIDLSWQPSPDADTAGYFVYRRRGDSAWQRVSGDRPLPGPAYHDAAVYAGQTYSYAVTAVDQGGHESAKSDAAQETVPTP